MKIYRMRSEQKLNLITLNSKQELITPHYGCRTATALSFISLPTAAPTG